MQSKVSMVVPCYNKEKYIGAMLESVIAQEWDNIEVILVNDGSTDRTREIITEYEPRIKARGYETVIINQDNAGCCAAVYAGLTGMTGDYFCLVDCDDVIESKYVSRMAWWLDTHGDCEWAACTFVAVALFDGFFTEEAPAKKRYRQDTDNLLEKYILRDTITTAWIYMTRVSYLRKCGLIENFCTERKKTYEPLIVVPLAHGKGKIEYFNEPLYRYNQTSLDLFRFNDFEGCRRYYDDYLYLFDWAIKRLDAAKNEKNRLMSIARLAYYRELSTLMIRARDGKEYEDTVAGELTALIDEIFDPAPGIPPVRIVKTGFTLLFEGLSANILGEKPDLSLITARRRVIGYGALGKAAAKIIPLLDGTALQPTELWDKNGDCAAVRKPDFDSLEEGDMMLVFPTSEAVLADIQAELENCDAMVLYGYKIWEIMPWLQFPQIIGVKLRNQEGGSPIAEGCKHYKKSRHEI